MISFLQDWLGITDLIKQNKLLNQKIVLLTQDIILLNNNQRKMTHIEPYNFPDIDDLKTKVQNYVFENVFQKSSEDTIKTINVTLKNFIGITTDFRFKNQSNHQLHMKLHSGISGDITKWLNLCEPISPLGIVMKDNTPCLNIKYSTTELRVCNINCKVPKDCIVYLQMKIPNLDQYVFGEISIT